MEDAMGRQSPGAQLAIEITGQFLRTGVGFVAACATMALGLQLVSAQDLPKPQDAPKTRVSPGDLDRAKLLNTQGLDLRKAGDNNAAKAKYQEALKVAPGYAPARYNLACELALAGDSKGALKHLEALAASGDPDSLRFVAYAGADSDFSSMRTDPRFQALLKSVEFDVDDKAVAQVCKEPWHVTALVHDELGLLHYRETEASPDDEGPRASKAVKVLKGKRARKVVARVLRANGFWCSSCVKSRGGDVNLSAVSKTHHCLKCDGEGEWGKQYELCFAKRGADWFIALVSEYPTGPLMEEYLDELDQRSRSSRKRALKRFRK